MTFRRYYVALLGLLLTAPVAAQEFAENNFDHYTMSQGMSHNVVNGITQDSTGYIWVTTSAGLNRYNGSRFIQFHSNYERHSLAAEELNGMGWLDKDRLAIYTVGLHILNTRTGETDNLYIPYHNKLYQYKFNMIVRTIGDAAGNIYILSRSGFYHFDKNHKLVYRFDFYSEAQVATEHFFFGRDMLQLDNDRLFIVAIDGLHVYDKNKKIFKRFEKKDSPLLGQFTNYPGNYYTPYHFLQDKPGSFFIMNLLSDTIVYVNTFENRKVISHAPTDSLIRDIHYRSRLIPINDSLLYITGHYSGFFKIHFDPRTGKVKMDLTKHFNRYFCSGIIKDKRDNLWIATHKGLFRENPERARVQVTTLPGWISDSFPNIRLDDVLVAGDKVYAGTRGAAGLMTFDRKTLAFEKQVLFNKYHGRGNSVFALAPIDSTHIALGTDWPMLIFDRKRSVHRPASPPHWQAGDWIADLYTDRKGNIWISAFNMQCYNPRTNTFKPIPSHPRLLTIPFSITEDSKGSIWMSGHGIARYNTQADSFDLFLDSFPFIKMSDKQVNSLVIDPNDNVWFNSNNNGLIKYDIGKKTFRHFTRVDGLPDDNIAAMIIVGNSLWIAGFSGIACMDLQTNRIISFGKEDGFPEMQVVKGARFYYDQTNQELYLGFQNAIARFNPFYIQRRRTPPDIFIENVVINGNVNRFLPDGRIETSWKDNEFIVSIGSINFSDSYTQRYAYRVVKDEHTPWQQLGNQPSFNVSNLSPGNYRIQVKTFSQNNRWPEQIKELNLVVLPPFWQNAWFIVLMAMVLAFLFYLLIRWRTGLARKKEMVKTHIEKLKADDYKNQFELEQISNYFSSSLTGKNTEEEVLWDVTSNLISKLDYVDCMIYLWNKDKTKMVQKAAFGPKGKPEFITEQVFEVLPGQGIVGHVIETRQPVLVNDTRIDRRYRVDDEFRLSEICVPILHNGELMGILDSEHYEPGYFKERDIKILTTIATLIANKLKQIESEKSLEATHKELTTTNEQLAEAQLSALQAQMNPHFVFNALNSIKRMILDGDNEKASRYLSKFALMIRMTLNHSKDIFVTLHENIEYLKTYLEMEQLRFDDSFTYSIFTGENIDASETAIPSLMIQPLVENAIWHGLMPSEKDKKIRIGFTQTDNKITCTIEDNGIGIRQSERMKASQRPFHNSLGLENLQNRIKIMNEKYDTDCVLQITDLKDCGRNGSGTCVVLKFNVITI
jgi:putative methionine-R-sulfoxide reductase with GAF domain